MQPVCVTVAPPRAPLRFPPKLTRCLGLCQIFIAIIGLALNIITIFIGGIFYAIFVPGLWCGILFIVAGSLEIGASYNRGKCLVIGTMVMSLISALFAMCGFLVISVVSICVAQEPCTHSDCYYHHKHPAGIITTNAMMVCIALLETIVAIWTSALCCRAVCCCDNSQVARAQYIATPHQMAPPILHNGQQIVDAQQQVAKPPIASSASAMPPTPPPAYEEKQPTA